LTAHRAKPTLTAARVRWFAEYVKRFPAWGVFHVALSDANYECGAAVACARTGGLREAWPADVREHAEWFDSLTPSQRRRLGAKAESL
jgi:hypothetical protein